MNIIYNRKIIKKKSSTLFCQFIQNNLNYCQLNQQLIDENTKFFNK